MFLFCNFENTSMPIQNQLMKTVLKHCNSVVFSFYFSCSGGTLGCWGRCDIAPLGSMSVELQWLWDWRWLLRLKLDAQARHGRRLVVGADAITFVWRWSQAAENWSQRSISKLDCLVRAHQSILSVAANSSFWCKSSYFKLALRLSLYLFWGRPWLQLLADRSL